MSARLAKIDTRIDRAINALLRAGVAPDALAMLDLRIALTDLRILRRECERTAHVTELEAEVARLRAKHEEA